MRNEPRMWVVSTVLVAGALLAGCGGDASPGCTTTLPGGSYDRSCDGCVMNGTVLSCAGCGDGHGGNPAAQLDTCTCASADATQGISNNHGVLECGGSGSASSGGSSGGCKSDSDCPGDCAQCFSGSCSNGYVSTISGDCVY